MTACPDCGGYGVCYCHHGIKEGRLIAAHPLGLPYRDALAEHLATCARNVEALTARALAAEARLAEAREVLRSVRTYGGRCVSCYRAPCAPDCRLWAVLQGEA